MDTAAAYQWDTVGAPLVDFCRQPRTAPDKRYLERLAVNLAPASRWEMLTKTVWSTKKAGPLRRLIRSVARVLGSS